MIGWWPSDIKSQGKSSFGWVTVCCGVFVLPSESLARGRCVTFRGTSQPTPQRRSPVQWSTGDLTTATLCFTARRPWISTSCREFRILLLASSPDLDDLNTRCPYSLNYIGCWLNTEYITRSPLQRSRSWQHNSRATSPISSGFVLLYANFDPAEGICYMMIVLT